MLTLKNPTPFAKPTAQLDPPAPVPERLPITIEISPKMKRLLDSQKQWQLQGGRRRKAVEGYASQLDLAREDQRRLLQASVASERDVDEITLDLDAATAKIQDCEQKLKLAEQQLSHSEQELKNTNEQVEREQVRALLTQLQAAAQVVDERIVSLQQAVNEAVPLMEAVAGLGFDLLNLKLNDAQTFFRIWLLDSCGAMRGCKTGLDVFLKRECWSETLPGPDQADHVRRH